MTPKTSAAALAGAAALGRTEQNGRTSNLTPRPSNNQGDRPFIVFIRAFGHFREWGKYSSQAESQAVIAQLRRHGFDATCERVAP